MANSLSRGWTFLKGLPWGKIGGGLSVAATVANSLQARRERRDQLQAALRDANLHNPNTDVSVVDPRFVVGVARTAGVVGPAIDSGKFSLEYVAGNDGALNVRFLHTLTLLSGGEIANLERMYVNGTEAPIEGSAATRMWSTTGLTFNPALVNRYFWVRDQVLQGSGPLYTRFHDIRRRMRLLIPGWEPTTPGGKIVIPEDVDPVIERLFNDLLAEMVSVLESARLRWRDDRLVRKPGNSNEQAAGEGAVTSIFSFGTKDDALPTSVIQQYAGGTFRSRTSGDGGTRPRIPGWLPSDTLEGLAFAINRHRFWKLEGDTVEIAPWEALPNVEYVLKGGGDFDGNPAKFARKYYRELSPEPRALADLEDLNPAIKRCKDTIPVRAMAFSDIGGSVPAGQLSWETYRKLLWTDEAYPSQAVQEKVIAEVNEREHGASQNQPRFSMNTVITGSQIESGEALDIAAECMCGHFVELAGKRIAFRPASPRSSAVTIGPDRRVKAPTWRMGKGMGRAANALEAVLPADHERNFRPSEVPRSSLENQVDRDGLSASVRQARGQIDNLAALRQNAIVLDRDSVDKREGEIIAKVESAADPIGLLKPMDIVTIAASYGDTLAEVQLVQPLAGQVRLVVREIDSDTYADKYFATPLTRDAGVSTTGSTGDPEVSFTFAGVKETPIGSGLTFAGWLVQVLNIDILDGGTLAVSFDGGATWSNPPHEPTETPTPNVFTRAATAATDETRKILVISNTWKLGRNDNILTLASQHGSGSTAKYFPSVPVTIPLVKTAPPEDLTVVVTAKPGDTTGFVGQLAVEEEEE